MARIIFVINSLGSGGAERHLLLLVSEMVNRGNLVSVAVLRRTPRGGAMDLENEFRQTGSEVVYLKSYGLWDIGRWLSLIKLVARFRPEILHSHLPRADLSAAIIKRVYPKIAWISTFHDSYKKGTYSGYLIFPIVGWNWKKADRFVAVSHTVKDWIVRVLGIDPEKITVIYHGIAASAQQPKKRADNAEPRIGCLARFEQRKGVQVLVQAMPQICKKFPRAELLLAGSDPAGYSTEIRELVEELGLKNNVKILGFCPTPLDFLGSLDVFAFASFTEGFGIVLLEAMSMRCAIVASDIYPLNRIVQNGVTGLLAEPGNSKLFAEAIVQLLENPQMRKQMGEGGYRRCVSEFSLSVSLGKLNSLYEQCLVTQRLEMEVNRAD